MPKDCDKPDNTAVAAADMGAIWAMNKDRNLKRLLLALCERMEAKNLAFETRNPDHPGVIRVFHRHESHLGARIHTLGQEPGRYGIQLDFPDLADNRPELVSDSREDLDLEHAIEIIAIHLELFPRPEPTPS